MVCSTIIGRGFLSRTICTVKPKKTKNLKTPPPKKNLGFYSPTLGGWRTDLFWPCIRWWRSFSVQFRRQYHTMSTQLSTDSCHPWSKDFVGQDKIAEPGFRSQSNQSVDWILMAIVLNPLTVLSTLAVYKNLKTTVVQTCQD